MNRTHVRAGLLVALAALVAACTQAPAKPSQRPTTTPTFMSPTAADVRWTCVTPDTTGVPLDEGAGIPVPPGVPVLTLPHSPSASTFLTVWSGTLISLPTEAERSCPSGNVSVEQDDRVTRAICLTGRRVLQPGGPVPRAAGTPGQIRRVLRLVDQEHERVEELLIGTTDEGPFIGARSNVSTCQERHATR